MDTRLKYYKTNQAKLPSITGKVIPEALFSKRNYHNVIYEKIKADIAPYDPENELNPIWVNSRGAIPRFDRGSIEIRIMDIQECPSADMAIVAFVIETIKFLVQEKFVDFETQTKWKTETLAQLLDRTTEQAQESVIDNADYLAVFGYQGSSLKASELWRHILENIVKSGNRVLENWRKELDVILQEGTLSTRIMKAVGQNHSHASIMEVYKRLSGCLAQNKMFLG
jgi:carboxylate-amine ligase